MALPSTRCPYCQMAFCLPSEHDMHVKVCPKRPMSMRPSSAPAGSKPKRDDDDGPGIGAALVAGAIIGSSFGGDSGGGGDDGGGSYGGGDFGGGGAGDSFGD